MVPIGITTEGRWVVERDEPERLRITDGRLPAVDATGSHVVLPGDPTHGGIDVRPADAAVGLLHDVDVVFPVLHGPWGEDGTIQGLLELAGIPYVGSGVFASAAAMDKGHMKAVLLAAGLEVGPYELVTACPVAVRSRRRPCAAGHTRDAGVRQAGARRIERRHHAGHAIRTTCPRRSKPHGPMTHGSSSRPGSSGSARSSAVSWTARTGRGPACARRSSVRPGHDFYDFEAKYLEDAVDLIVPADLPAEVEASVRAQAVQAFDALTCEGLARVDFFVTPEGRAIVNEVNTMPGFTSISMFPRMWQATGMTYPELVDHLIADALRRGTGLR